MTVDLMRLSSSDVFLPGDRVTQLWSDGLFTLGQGYVLETKSDGKMIISKTLSGPPILNLDGSSPRLYPCEQFRKIK